jgi:hypothetical protein
MHLILDMQYRYVYISNTEETAKLFQISKAPFVETFVLSDQGGFFFTLLFCKKVALDVSLALARIHIYTNWFCSFKLKSLHFFRK